MSPITYCKTENMPTLEPGASTEQFEAVGTQFRAAGEELAAKESIKARTEKEQADLAVVELEEAQQEKKARIDENEDILERTRFAARAVVLRIAALVSASVETLLTYLVVPVLFGFSGPAAMLIAAATFAAILLLEQPFQRVLRLLYAPNGARSRWQTLSLAVVEAVFLAATTAGIIGAIIILAQARELSLEVAQRLARGEVVEFSAAQHELVGNAVLAVALLASLGSAACGAYSSVLSGSWRRRRAAERTLRRLNAERKQLGEDLKKARRQQIAANCSFDKAEQRAQTLKNAVVAAGNASIAKAKWYVDAPFKTVEVALARDALERAARGKLTPVGRA